MSEHRSSPGDGQEQPAPQPSWTGGFRPYTVGDPGRSAGVRSALAGPVESGYSDVAADEAYVSDGQGRPAAEVRAASTRGRAHRHYGRPRQDAYAFRRTQDGRYLVAAVADGVSAGRRSHLGSRRAAAHACNRLTAELEHRHADGLDWPLVVERVCAEIRRLAVALADDDEQLLDVREIEAQFATTLLLAVVELAPDEDGNLAVLLLPIGDSSAWALRAGREWEPLTAVKNDADVLENGTAALPHAPRELGPPVQAAITPGDALVLVTDGIGDPLGRGTGPVGQFLAAHWAVPPPALEFAAHVDFARRSFDDDRTALAIWPAATEPAETPT